MSTMAGFVQRIRFRHGRKVADAFAQEMDGRKPEDVYEVLARVQKKEAPHKLSSASLEFGNFKYPRLRFDPSNRRLPPR